MFSEQRIRAALFYLSLFAFCIGLPFLLSFALGYKFNPRNFTFTKTGLVVLKTQPEGASVFLDNILYGQKTPVTINELFPGKYSLRIEMDKCYPWTGEVNVEADKVSRLEKIILFPLRPDVKQVNRDRVSSFWIDEEKSLIFYVNPDENSVYRMDFEGQDIKKVVDLLEMSPMPLKWKISPDKARVLYFNTRALAVSQIPNENGFPFEDQSFVRDYSQRRIVDAFWHSDSFHFIVITQKDIEAVEAAPNAEPVKLMSLSQRNTRAFYDLSSDSLYFLDTQKAADGKLYDNIYKLSLGSKVRPLSEIRKFAPALEKIGVGKDDTRPEQE